MHLYSSSVIGTTLAFHQTDNDYLHVLQAVSMIERKKDILMSFKRKKK